MHDTHAPSCLDSTSLYAQFLRTCELELGNMGRHEVFPVIRSSREIIHCESLVLTMPCFSNTDFCRTPNRRAGIAHGEAPSGIFFLDFHNQDAREGVCGISLPSSAWRLS